MYGKPCSACRYSHVLQAGARPSSKSLLAVVCVGFLLLCAAYSGSARSPANNIPWVRQIHNARRANAVNAAIVSSLARLARLQAQRQNSTAAPQVAPCAQCGATAAQSTEASSKALCTCTAVVVITRPRVLPYIQVLLATLLPAATARGAQVHILNTAAPQQDHPALQQALAMFPEELQVHASEPAESRCARRTAAWHAWECTLAYDYAAALHVCKQVRLSHR